MQHERDSAPPTFSRSRSQIQRAGPRDSVGFARGIVFRDAPALRYLGEAVFPVYILHQTVIAIVAWSLRGFEQRPLFGLSSASVASTAQ